MCTRAVGDRFPPAFVCGTCFGLRTLHRACLTAHYHTVSEGVYRFAASFTLAYLFFPFVSVTACQ